MDYAVGEGRGAEGVRFEALAGVVCYGVGEDKQSLFDTWVGV